MKIFIILLMLFSFSYADKDHHHHYGKDFSYLSLSEKQEKKVKNILKEYQKKLKEYRHFKRSLLKKKKKLFLDANFDSEELKNINKQINERETAIELKLIKSLHKILTKEQKYKFIDYIEEWEIE